jgi:FAD:protein FMN transferase
MVQNTLGSLLADALATAAFILGLEEGLKLVKRYGTEALFVDEKRNIYLTPQLKEYFYSSNGHNAWLK